MFKKLNDKLIKSVKSKRINIFLLFLVMSFGILILTKLSKTYTNTIVFHIEKKNIPETEVIIHDSLPTLNITLKTQGFNYLKYYFKKPKIELDFSNKINRTDSIYVWNNQTAFSDIISQFDSDIEVLNINPDTLWFRYDENDIKKVPIKLNSYINFKLGFDVLKDFNLEPDSIKVIGPKSVLSNIDIVETSLLEINEVTSDFSKQVQIKVPSNSDNVTFSPSKVMVSAKVEKFTEGKLKIPVEVVNVPESLQIKFFPKTVTLSYYTSLSNFNSIGIEDFNVVCDFKTINSNQNYLEPKLIKKPSGVKNIKLNLNQIEFIITE